MGNIVTEIRSFYSIKEIYDVLEEDIAQCKSMADEYSQWLGSFLRDSEFMQENGEWVKKMSMLQKGKPKGKEKAEIDRLQSTLRKFEKTMEFVEGILKTSIKELRSNLR